MFNNLTNYEKNALKKCPFCGSYSINKENHKTTTNDRFKQATNCSVCNRKWCFIYNEDKSYINVDLTRVIK